MYTVGHAKMNEHKNCQSTHRLQVVARKQRRVFRGSLGSLEYMGFGDQTEERSPEAGFSKFAIAFRNLQDAFPCTCIDV